MLGLDLTLKLKAPNSAYTLQEPLLLSPLQPAVPPAQELKGDFSLEAWLFPSIKELQVVSGNAISYPQTPSI